MIYVFLNKKLVSCDSILPVVMEIHKRTGQHVIFMSFDKKTYEGIRRNHVIWDAIHSIGQFRLAGGEKSWTKPRLWRRIAILKDLTRCAVNSLIHKASFIHFKALDEWPLKFLWYVNRHRTYRFESDSYGMSEFMARLTFINKDVPIYRRTPVGAVFVGYQPTWPILKHPETVDRRKFVIGPPRSRKVWIDHIANAEVEYFKREFIRAKIPEAQEIIAYMLGYLGSLDYIRSPTSLVKLLEETLDTLVEVADGRPIFIKPHVITDLDILDQIITKYPEGSIVISHLHPTVLCARARLVVSNYYSSTLADAFLMNVPTIEYTDYTDAALKITENGSMRPEFISHFINAEKDAFRITAAQILQAPRHAPPVGKAVDESGFFDFFCHAV